MQPGPGTTLSDTTARSEFGLTQEEIVSAINARKLQYRPASMHGNPWLRPLRREVEELVRTRHGDRYLRERQARTDAYSAYVLAYDAARFACNALPAQQGMRATTDGGHYAVERAVRAQFGEGFRPFADLRRRRNELEYPRMPADTATADEAQQAVEIAQRLITAADSLLGQLSFFAPPGVREP